MTEQPFRLVTQEACPQCGCIMEDEHQHLKCPECHFIIPCCEGGDIGLGDRICTRCNGPIGADGCCGCNWPV